MSPERRQGPVLFTVKIVGVLVLHAAVLMLRSTLLEPARPALAASDVLY